MMNTLFPPLPSQGGIAAVEQQVQYLTMNQHAQPPAITGAQLQALLQQAQYQAARESAGASSGAAGVEGAASSAADVAERAAQKAAGEQLIRNVEQRIQEHEMFEQKRKAKAAKIAALVSQGSVGHLPR
jgi:DNA topoisomerase 2-associated protein PAT1